MQFWWLVVPTSHRYPMGATRSRPHVTLTTLYSGMSAAHYLHADYKQRPVGWKKDGRRYLAVPENHVRYFYLPSLFTRTSLTKTKRSAFNMANTTREKQTQELSLLQGSKEASFDFEAGSSPVKTQRWSVGWFAWCALAFAWVLLLLFTLSTSRFQSRGPFDGTTHSSHPKNSA